MMNKTEFQKGTLINSDCMEALNTIPDNSVDCVITSPPYYQLRDYGYPEQWGLEPDYRDYLDKMIRLMEELKRIIKPTGTIWINLGDTYSKDATINNNGQGRTSLGMTKKGSMIGDKTINHTKNPIKVNKLLPDKSLMLIPQRFAIRCIDELGLICRNEIIWAKPNGMPESVTDRFSKKHEQIYFFTKESKYYFDLDAVKDSLIRFNVKNIKFGGNKKDGNKSGIYSGNYYDAAKLGGKNPGDVADFWEIPTKPNRSNHYATYNSDLIIKPLLAGCPEGGVVLDPFAGTGTTGLTAINYNRRYIMIEASGEYYKQMVEHFTQAESQPTLWEAV